MNTLILFLKELNIKYTKTFINKVYLEHPYRDTMGGIADILKLYNIIPIGINLSQKKLIPEYCPFIAHFENNFVVVSKIEEEVVYYWKEGHSFKLSSEKFRQIWSGYTLFAETSEESIEPDYKKNFKNQICNKLIKYVSILFLFYFPVFALFSTNSHNILFYVLYAITLGGVFISLLLLLKQYKINNSLGDKICFMFQQKDCTGVLQSKGAKFLNIFSWSEIGLAFYIFQALIMSFFPKLYIYSLAVNILAITYTFWSITYQYFIVKQWCVLCLIVQVLIVTNAVISIFEWNNFNFQIVDLINLNFIFYIIPLAIGLVFLIHYLSIHLFLEENIHALKRKMTVMKLNKDIWQLLSKNQKYVLSSLSDSSIIFGDSTVKNKLTIVSNPHCGSCARIDKQINELLQFRKDKIYIQYIFTYWDDESEMSSKILIACYKQNSKEKANHLYQEWFERGRYARERFHEKNSIKKEYIQEVEKEFKNHDDWINQVGIGSTPTLIYNNYILPDGYQINDLKFIPDDI